MSNIPEDLLYTQKHEWVKETDGLLVLGITDYAQNSLGDVVYVDLQPVDTELAAGDTFGTIESVKAAEDLYCPAGGTVAEVNPAINDDPASVNKDAYAAWMIKLKDYNKDGLSELMNAAAYGEYLASLG